MIWIGAYLIAIGVGLMACGIETALKNKMENNTDYQFSVKTANFNDMHDENGKKTVITYIGADKVVDK